MGADKDKISRYVFKITHTCFLFCANYRQQIDFPSREGGRCKWWMREVLFHKTERDNIQFYVYQICNISRAVEDASPYDYCVTGWFVLDCNISIKGIWTARQKDVYEIYTSFFVFESITFNYVLLFTVQKTPHPPPARSPFSLRRRLTDETINFVLLPRSRWR